MLTQEHSTFFRENGYVVVKALFSADEVTFYREHYMQLRTSGSYAGDLVVAEPTSNNPLKRYPRMIHMHRWDEVSLRWLLDQRV